MNEASENRRKRYQTVLVILGLTVAIDWVTKRLAENHLQHTATNAIEYLWNTVRIQYAENTGAFLGMGNAWSPALRFWVFTAATSAFLAFVAITTMRRPNIHRYELVAVSLILGGGIGNLLDRIFRDGAVVDFMNLGIGTLRTGIFNVADVALTGGVVLWCFIPRPKEAKEEAESKQATVVKEASPPPRRPSANAPPPKS